MGVDYWQRIIELERRQMRFDTNRQETETRLTQAQNRVNIVSSGSFASIHNVINFAMYPVVSSIQLQLNSFKVLDSGWQNKTFWNYYETTISGLNYLGIDEPASPTAGSVVSYTNLFQNSVHENFFNQTINLSYTSTITSGVTVETNYTGSIYLGQLPDFWEAEFKIIFNTITGKALGSATIRINDTNQPTIQPFIIKADSITSEQKILENGTSGTLTINQNGSCFFNSRNQGGPPVVWTPGYFRNPVFSLTW